MSVQFHVSVPLYVEHTVRAALENPRTPGISIRFSQHISSVTFELIILTFGRVSGQVTRGRNGEPGETTYHVHEVVQSTPFNQSIYEFRPVEWPVPQEEAVEPGAPGESLLMTGFDALGEVAVNIGASLSQILGRNANRNSASVRDQLQAAMSHQLQEASARTLGVIGEPPATPAGGVAGVSGSAPPSIGEMVAVSYVGQGGGGGGAGRGGGGGGGAPAFVTVMVDDGNMRLNPMGMMMAASSTVSMGNNPPWSEPSLGDIDLMSRHIQAMMADFAAYQRPRVSSRLTGWAATVPKRIADPVVPEAGAQALHFLDTIWRVFAVINGHNDKMPKKASGPMKRRMSFD